MGKQDEASCKHVCVVSSRITLARIWRSTNAGNASLASPYSTELAFSSESTHDYHSGKSQQIVNLVHSLGLRKYTLDLVLLPNNQQSQLMTSLNSLVFDSF